PVMLSITRSGEHKTGHNRLTALSANREIIFTHSQIISVRPVDGSSGMGEFFLEPCFLLYLWGDEAPKKQVSHRRKIEGGEGGKPQSADNHPAERDACFRAGTRGEHKRQAADHRTDHRHRDWTKADERGLLDSFAY